MNVPYDHPIMDVFGAALREARREAGLGEAEICTLLEISTVDHYLQWEQGNARPNRVMYLRILEVFPQLEPLDPDWAHGWGAAPVSGPSPTLPVAPAPTFRFELGAPRIVVRGPTVTAADEWMPVVAKSADSDREESSAPAEEQENREAPESLKSEPPASPIARGGRTKLLRVRVSPEQKALFEQAARCAGLDASSWLRGIGIQAARRSIGGRRP